MQTKDIGELLQLFSRNALGSVPWIGFTEIRRQGHQSELIWHDVINYFKTQVVGLAWIKPMTKQKQKVIKN